MRSPGIAFVPADVAQDVLEVRPDGVTVHIVEVMCQSYGIIMCLASRALKRSIDFMLESFTARELGTYLEKLIRIRQETLALTTLTGYFHVRLAVADLHRAYLGH